MQEMGHAFEIDAFLQICKEHHLKVTPQRMAIYKHLLREDTHPNADSVYQTVKQECPNISFDTVNRTLLTFAQIGIVDVVEIFGGAKRFDPNVTTHHHLHCTQCGKVFDFYSRAYDNLTIPEELHAQFHVTSKRVVLKGICKKCRSKN
jgi:Fur family peroxide stress response transcriptional regulator